MVKVGIASVQVPFIRGGAENLANSLSAALTHRGISNDIITMPFKWYPPHVVLDHMLAARLLDLTEVNGQKIDRLITLKFPAFYIQHTNKVAWILHQHRQAYDLHGTHYGDLHQDDMGCLVTKEIRNWDNYHLAQHSARYTISQLVTDRLLKYNQLSSSVLYPPPMHAERFFCAEYEPFILVPGRVDPMKRQHLIVEALANCPADLRLVIIGPKSTGGYSEKLREQISKLGLNTRVDFRGEVDENEKLRLFANCLAVYNGVYKEDYGYITLEGLLSSKPVITHDDSGGPLEFIKNGENGFIVPASPRPLAEVVKHLYYQPALAREMGSHGLDSLKKKNISWDYIVERLLA